MPAMSSDALGSPVTAPPRFRTLSLMATASVDSVAMARLMRRQMEEHRRRHGPRSAVMIDILGGGSSDASDGEWDRHGWRIRWAPPAHWREELVWPGGHTAVMIARPGVALSYLSGHRTLYTSEAPVPGVVPRLGDLFRSMFRGRNAWPAEAMHLSSVAERVAQFPLTNPRLPAPEWEHTTLGTEEYLGRAVRRVRATRRTEAMPDSDDGRRSGYWPWLDEYEYLADDALGILLRLTGLEDGVPIGLITADEVQVDAPMPDDVFTFVAPAGTRTTHVTPRT